MLLTILKPVLVVPVVAVLGAVGMALSIITAPIWIPALWFSCRNHMNDQRYLQSHHDLQTNGLSGWG
jgi:hypothetical protein